MKRYSRVFLIFLFLAAVAQGSRATDYFWVGGSGNWSDINHWATASGGLTKHIVVPSPADNVFFDANSFTLPKQVVVVDANIATCRNISIGNVVDTPSLSGSSQLRIYGSFLWSRKMNWQFTGPIYFEAVTPGFSIRTDSIVLNGEVCFRGIGGSWMLLDRLKTAGNVTLEYGSLNTNGKTLECRSFMSNYTNMRGLTLGTSRVYLTSVWSVNQANLTLSADQSFIQFSNVGNFASTGSGTAAYYLLYFNAPSSPNSSTLNVSTATFAGIHFAGNGSVAGAITTDTLVFSAGFSYNMASQTTIQKKFDSYGHCLSPISIKGSWLLSMPAAAIFYVNYCFFSGVTASGGNTFLAQSSFDNGGNTGLNFPPPAPRDLYWVGGAGYWNDTTHWSSTSGGPGGKCPPTEIDNVWFNANSLSSGDSVVIDTLMGFCHDMHWVSIPMNVKFTKYMDLEIHGSLWLHHNLEWDGAMSQTWFKSDQIGETITSDNVVLKGPVFFDGNGSWTLQDNFEVEGHGVDQMNGTWNTNSKQVKIAVYHSSSGANRTLTLGSSHFIVTNSHVQAWTLMGQNFTLNAGTSLVDISAPGGGMYNTSTWNFNFYDVIFSDSSGLAQLNTDNNNFHVLTFNSNGFIRGFNQIGTLNFTKGKDYSLAYNNTQTILTALNANGGCDGYILLHSDDKDSTTNISKGAGVVNCQYMIIWNVKAVGGATFNALSSVDVGGNTGWNFTSPLPKNLYWVGGQGNWSDVNHWSLTSGGPGGACVPSPLDSIFFDVNSFLNAFDTVFVDLTNATCHTMTWKDTLQNARLFGPDYNTMWFWGSVIFDTTMLNAFKGNAMFEAKDTGHIIVMANQYFLQDVIFEGRGGGWRVVDSLNILRFMIFKHGKINAEEKLIQTGNLTSTKSSERTLNIINATVKVSGSQGAWELYHDSLTFLASGSELIFLAPGFINFNNLKAVNDTVLFHNITFEHNFSYAALLSSNLYCKFNVATFKGNANFMSNFGYDSLMMTEGHTYKFELTTEQTFNHITASGTCFKPIIFTWFTTVNPPAPAYSLKNLTSSATVNQVELQGCIGVGPSSYLASNSVDNGNNVNWTITPVGPVDLYWVNGTGLWWNPFHWSYTSGGTGGACIPTYRDNVFFDQNSFFTPTDTVTIDSTFAECHNMQWQGFTGNPQFRHIVDQLNIYGSLRMDTAMRAGIYGPIRFVSTHTGNTIFCGSQVFSDSVIFHGNGGAWTLLDSLTATQTINFIQGDLNTNGQIVTARNFLSINILNRKLSLGNSTLKLDLIMRLNGLNLIFDAGTSNILLRNNNAQLNSENGQGFTYYNVHMTSLQGLSTLRLNNCTVKYNKVTINNSGLIVGAHVFDSLLFMPGNLYQLEKGKTQTINKYWLLRGNNCFPLTLQSTVFGQQATVFMPAGQQVAGDFLHIRDIAATGGATFFAGINSTDVSNNTGWNFSSSPGYIFGLGPDIQFTIGSTITLSTANFNGGPGTVYQWSTGATTPNITVSQPGTYSVTVTYAGNCVVVDTIKVFCDVQPSYVIGNCICYGDSTGWINMSIQDTVGTYTALWSNGSTQLNVANLTAGQYIVVVNGSTGCDGTDTLNVIQPPPVIVPLNDTSFCEDSPGVLLDATSAFMKFWWDGVSGGQSIFVSQEDTIVVIVEDGDGCRSAPDTIKVTIDTIPYLWLGEDQEICLGESVKLLAGYGFNSYLWQNGSTKPDFTVTQGGTYFVTIHLRTCVNQDTILFFDCPPLITFPNVFTPNGDGYNDHFYPVEQNIYQYKLVIFNRWGGTVFTSNDPKEKWDGNFQGVPCAEGTYYFSVEYHGFGQKALQGTKVHHGSVTLLR
jgi:gliding motility-associated-like protein